MAEKKGGLTLSRNPREELQRLMEEEGKEPVAPAPPAVESDNRITSNTVSQSGSLLTDRPTDQPVSGQADGLSDQSASQQADRQADPPTDRPTAQPTEQPGSKLDAHAVAKVKAMGKSRARAVTLKLPEELDDYVTQHTKDNWKDKVLKQDIVRRALQLAIIEIETGVKFADLD